MKDIDFEINALFFYRFIVENFVFEKHLRYILTVYPVVIVALSGNMTKNFKSADPSRSGIYIGEHACDNGFAVVFLICCAIFHDNNILLFPTAVLLGLTCTLFAIKVLLVIWRHIKRPLYEGMNTEEEISPMEIAEKQKKIFT